MSQSSSPFVSRGASRLACALLAGVVLVLFGRVVGFPFIAFDDVEFILRNPEVSAPLRAPLDLLLTPHVGYVVPVTVGLQALLFALGHGAPWPFHAAALALHALYVCQVYWLLRRLGATLPAAVLAALLFAVHPLVVQPVAWAICIKDLLMANLVLLSLRSLLAALDQPKPRSAVWATRTAVLVATLAMLAKPTAALIGFAWLGYAWSLRQHDPERARKVLRPALLVAVAGVVIGSASRFLHHASFGGTALAPWTPITPLEVLGRQLVHVFWPVDLLVMYPGPGGAPSLTLRVLGAGAALLAVAALFAVRHNPRALLLFVLALAIYLPTSNIVPFARVISDSYLYVPLSMLACGVGLLASHALVTAPAQVARAFAGVAIVLALVLAVGSSIQLERYRGGAALWGPVTRAYPRFSNGHIYFADELVFRGQPARAAASFQRGFATGYDPSHLLEFGTSLMLANRLADAECVLIEAAAYGTEPGYARFNLAALLAAHPDYVPRYPAIVAPMLQDIDRLRQAGRIAWPRPLEPGLRLQLERVRRAARTDVAWRKRNCSVLAAQ